MEGRDLASEQIVWKLRVQDSVKWEISCKDKEIMCYCVFQTTALPLDLRVIWKLFQTLLETLKHLCYK